MSLSGKIFSRSAFYPWLGNKIYPIDATHRFPSASVKRKVYQKNISDLHDSSNIVIFMLDINGFEVIDLGVDVSPAKFVEAAKKSGAPVVGLSGFLTLAFDPMKETIAVLKAAGLNVKTMIGGGQIDEQIKEYTGADA